MATEINLTTNEQREQAAQKLATDVYAPAFFEKLASHGIRPRSYADVEAMLTLGDELLAKQAAEVRSEQPNDFLKLALERLQPKKSEPTANDEADLYKAAVERASKDADLCAAALIVGSTE